MNQKELTVPIRSSRSLAIISFIAIICGACQSAPDSNAKTPKAVFIIVDGIPADVLEHVATPYMDAISGESGYTHAYVGGDIDTESESPTVSAVGYNSLLTGTWSNKHNVWDNEVAAPNYEYWDIFRIAKTHDPSLPTAIFSTWTDNRTKLLGDGMSIAGGKKLDYSFDGFELDTDRFPHDIYGNYIKNIDGLVTEEAARYIKTHGPTLSWVYLQHTDDIGHRYGDSPEQIDAVKLMDERVGAIWEAIQARQSDHDEDWLLVVTTDHGRDQETGRNHGGQSERERTIWIVTNSRRLNSRFNALPGMVDILPSLATHLQLKIPDAVQAQLDGQSFID